MKLLTILAAAGITVAGPAVAEEPPATSLPYPGPVYATPRMVQQPYGRPAIVGVTFSSTRPVETRPKAVLDCSTDARTEGELTVPYACVALPEWPSSGTPFSIEDESRRRFEGQ